MADAVKRQFGRAMVRHRHRHRHHSDSERSLFDWATFDDLAHEPLGHWSLLGSVPETPDGYKSIPDPLSVLAPGLSRRDDSGVPPGSSEAFGSLDGGAESPGPGLR